MVKHLPPSIKHLLTLRNPHPLPSPPVGKLREVFARTKKEAEARKAETGWLVLTTCTLLTVNRPSTVGELFRFVSEDSAAGTTAGDSANLSETVNRAAIMRESALKSTVFVGVPRVILAMSALHEALGEDVRGALRKNSRRVANPENIDSVVKRGRALWDSIYAPHADKLHDKLGSYHPDFISFIIQAYGSVLSPLPGGLKYFSDQSTSEDLDQGNLSRTMGSVVGIACLRAEERVVPQLTSHVFGLLKARYNAPEFPKSEEDVWLASDEGTEWAVRTVDEIVDVVKASSGPGEDQLKVKL